MIAVNCSLNWQHQLCKNPRPNPDIKTLFVDHTCGQPNGARAPSPASNPLLGSLPKAGGFPPLGAHGVGTSFRLFSYWTFLGLICACLMYLCMSTAFSTNTSTCSSPTCWMDVQSSYCEPPYSFWWTHCTWHSINSRCCCWLVCLVLFCYMKIIVEPHA